MMIIDGIMCDDEIDRYYTILHVVDRNASRLTSTHPQPHVGTYAQAIDRGAGAAPGCLIAGPPFRISKASEAPEGEPASADLTTVNI
jgi:hypothetical protein